jgi:hypothetical protein
MIWLTWRQFRAQGIVAAAALVVLALALAVTGPHIASLFARSGVPGCHTACAKLANNFINEVSAESIDRVLFFASLVLVYAVPGLIGAFWGAPLVTRELETGTFRLAWTQSVTRGRWIAVKLGLLGLAAMATAGLASLAVTWWASPVERAFRVDEAPATTSFSRLDPLVFGARGIVPLGYAAFAFALGVTAGVLLRRTLPAMAATLACFAFVQACWPTWIRPHLITPLRDSLPLNAASLSELEVNSGGHMTVIAAISQPGAWVLSNLTVTRSGRVFTGPAPSACLGPNGQACLNWLNHQHLRALVSYEPASRFWAFQWDETAIFVGLALALAAFCLWRVRRRRLA